MRVVRVDPAAPHEQAIAAAAELIRAGRLVAFPTETVYGLGANALDPAAIDRIYEAKGRPAGNPLIVHVADAEMARALVLEWPPVAGRLATAFWPGPLTLVLRKRPVVPDRVTAGLPTVAVRVPAHPVALALIRAAGVPIAAPSANRSTEVSPTTARHVVKSLGEAVDLVLDAGPTRVGVESTVVDVTREPPLLLRPGGVSAEAIAAVAGRVERPGTAAAIAGGARPSPGMLHRHYAPRARVVLFGPGEREEARAEATRLAAAGHRTGALLLTALDAPFARAFLMPTDPAGYASWLYAALHALEDAACDTIFVERVPDDPGWLAIRDRLARSAAPR